MTGPPTLSWKRKLDAPLPSDAVHTFARPPILEALSLLPVAYRVASYLSTEQSAGRDPIFDLQGMFLEPPNPGPHAGVPLGGMGGGCIGRGFQGDFRRWSLQPGKYIHRIVHANQFSIRVKRGMVTHTAVLSYTDPPLAASNYLRSWNWHIPKDCGTYHGLFPRAWTSYHHPVPYLTITIRQVSPFLPHSYSESSFPVGAFEVDVENVGSEEIDVSVMFTFQHGDGGARDMEGGSVHQSFAFNHQDGEHSVRTQGVCMSRRNKIDEGGVKQPANPCTEFMKAMSSQEPKSTKTGAQTDDFGHENTSFSIAVSNDATERKKDCIAVISHCDQFVVDEQLNVCKSGNVGTAITATDLWEQFSKTGDVCGSQSKTSTPAISADGQVVGAAVCIRQKLSGNPIRDKSPSGHKASFSFALAWDLPVARFGPADGNSTVCDHTHHTAPRYYTRFFGTSGLCSPTLCGYALSSSGYRKWEQSIVSWQHDTIQLNTPSPGSSTVSKDAGEDVDVPPEYFQHQLFNELYYLVDGGTVWCNTVNELSGIAPCPDDQCVFRISDDAPISSHWWNAKEFQPFSSGVKAMQSPIVSSPIGVNNCATPPPTSSELEQLLLPTNSTAGYTATEAQRLDPIFQLCNWLDVAIKQQSNLFNDTAPGKFTDCVRDSCNAHDIKARKCRGDQQTVGQFLYLEGHEYLMYNTYDVHFYASFALMMLFPMLELSLQYDIGLAVHSTDEEHRCLLGEGVIAPRKVKGAVPHDIGSPSEQPWTKTNIYNFQDVSKWKDLGPKFVLQVYKDIKCIPDVVMRGVYANEKSNTDSGPCGDGTAAEADPFLVRMYPIVLAVMEYQQQFCTLQNDMIQNSGFPDQTYDIWTATGTSAYCGGLWIAACSAMSQMAATMEQCGVTDKQGSSAYTHTAAKYATKAENARKVYQDQLWNGRYYQYDNSQNAHATSIMSDMCAGQWYARVCGLPPVMPSHHAVSCLRTIFQANVVSFSMGSEWAKSSVDSFEGSKQCTVPDGIQWKGAVNGMKANGTDVENMCLQSREVWTGTTYALAATMLLEATHLDEGREQPSSSLSVELQNMGYHTAQGIHDAGWCEYGYQYATPEAWEAGGQYRSLGYMRPLCVWSMQWAREQR